jgi:phage terminase large subunit-like protein
MRINKHAQRSIDFIERLNLTGDYLNKPTVLRPWQKDIVSRLFGTVKPDGRLQYEKCFLFLPRKVGKTELAASILLYCLLGRGKRGQELYSAAATREQAGRIYKAAASKIRQDPYLNSICKCTDSKKRIDYPGADSFYVALSSDAKGKFGDRPCVVLLDEMHALPNRDLYNALMSGFGATLEPLTIMISTAGDDRSGLTREQFSYSKKLITGLVENPTYLPILYYAEEEDDWESEAVWHKVIPALGDFCRLDFIRNEYKEAKDIPAKQASFRQFYLNQFVDSNSETKFMPDAKWMACERAFTEDDLLGKSCFAGFDGSVSNDWSSLVLVFPINDEFFIWPYFWVPLGMSSRREQRDIDLWTSWEDKGLLKIQGGKQDDVLDHDEIQADIAKIGKKFNIRRIVVDKAYVNTLALRLRDEEYFDVQAFNQSIINMSPATAELHRLIHLQKIVHDGNPVARWHMSNACTTKADKNGNVALSKGRSADKIDFCVALCMGLATAQQDQPVIPGVIRL